MTRQLGMFKSIPTADQPKGDARDVQRRREHRALERDVWIPPIEDPKRRAACKYDLRLFCETYLKSFFPIRWSPDHLTMIARLEDCVLHGRRYTLAAARGTGKTTRVRA